jgi:hypothetical protein
LFLAFSADRRLMMMMMMMMMMMTTRTTSNFQTKKYTIFFFLRLRSDLAFVPFRRLEDRADPQRRVLVGTNQVPATTVTPMMMILIIVVVGGVSRTLLLLTVVPLYLSNSAIQYLIDTENILDTMDTSIRSQLADMEQATVL